ncbi:toxin-antitoxin system HicB family antitoxin [Actinomycetospora termitidis]|uniref:Toxin-antitoxin system HicB family antitoxin n=1 Tax=Actinomycetospora termitidis TaxID=3053470 RepID=A0ABT7M9Q7_9PSEU|nr:toxin-antitoxin system HicB family antitoxin [Actinomycetospora sp. Odt1-22]MDL5157381.1 toxin-antitoxin system HicB family antitoxin [Actinomycetospora sp. Odt1-22]
MDLSPFVDRLADELTLAAEAGGDEARAVAARLSASLSSSVRLVLLEALAEAADEITRDLAPGSVEVRLRGREPGFVVNPPVSEPPAAPAGARTEPEVESTLELDAGPTTRINLRLPDALKARVEEAAGREHLSINAWLVRAASGALATGAGDASRARGRRGQSFTGWVR